MPPIFMHSYMVQHLLDRQYDLEAIIQDLNDQKERWLDFSSNIVTSNGFNLFDTLAEVPMEHWGEAMGLEKQWHQSIIGFMNSPAALSIINSAGNKAFGIAQANKQNPYTARHQMEWWTYGQLMKQKQEVAKNQIAKMIDKKCKDIDKQLHQFQKQKMIVDQRLQAEQQAEAQGIQQTKWGYSLA